MITERLAQEQPPGPDEARPRPGFRALFAGYLSLTKPQIVELILVTTIPAMMFAAGGWPDLGLMAVVLIGGGLAAGAASTFNCYIDRDIDQLMRRTKRRPLPSHTITPRAVLIFGTILTVVSLTLMATFTNWLATGLTAASIFYYDVIYTIWLKRRTPTNTFWGGICGAAPVLIAWAAVTGTVGPVAWALFAVVFFWQMPHFYPLAIKYKDDYARAGIPMLPVVRSARRVNTEILLFTVLTLVSSLAAWPLGAKDGMGPIYGITAIVSGAFFLLEALRLAGRSRRGEPLKAMRLFHWSITYLTILFIAVAVDALI
ncbi:heme o synthase [Winogradskya consettensis]|nr:heme o synthase [Actinoplanes consettensis]